MAARHSVRRAREGRSYPGERAARPEDTARLTHRGGPTIQELEHERRDHEVERRRLGRQLGSVALDELEAPVDATLEPVLRRRSGSIEHLLRWVEAGHVELWPALQRGDREGAGAGPDVEQPGARLDQPQQVEDGLRGGPDDRPPVPLVAVRDVVIATHSRSVVGASGAGRPSAVEGAFGLRFGAPGAVAERRARSGTSDLPAGARAWHPRAGAASP